MNETSTDSQINTNGNGHSWHQSSWIKYLVTAIVTMLVASLVVDVRIVDAERASCVRRQPIYTTLAGLLEGVGTSIDARKDNEFTSTRERIQSRAFAADLHRRADIISRLIVQDCDKAYPKIIPFAD